MSGGRATLRQRAGEANRTQVGDIGAIDALGEKLLLRYAIIECKFHRNMDFVLAVTRQRGRLWRWWNIERAKAEVAAREPILIARENHTPPLLITTGPVIKRLRLKLYADPLYCLYRWPDAPSVYLFDEVVPRLPSKLAKAA